MPYRLGTPYTLALLLTALFMFGLAGATLRHRNERASKPLFGFLLGIGLWSLGDALRVAAPTEATVLLWNRVAYAGIVFVPPTLLLFVLAYTGHRRWLQRRYVAGLLSISVLVLGVILTNPVHSLWLDAVSIAPGTAPPVLSEEWGPLWYPWAVYVYSVVLAVTFLMARRAVEADRAGIHRVQTGLVLTGVLVAAGVNVLFIADVFPFDPTPFAFAITGLAFGVAMFRYRLLTVVPIARNTVLGNMDSGVLVLDAEDRVADTNDALREMFDLEERAVRGDPLSALFAGYPSIRDRLESPEQSGPVEIETDGGSRYYDVKSSRMYDAVDTYVGRVFVFTDITRRVNQQEQLRERTDELERRNEQLDQFASVVSHDLRNPLGVISGRARLAADAADPGPHLDSIADAADRMEAIIDEVLTLARQGETVGQTTPTPLDEVVERAWAFVDADGATLSVETSMTVEADPDRLQAVLENLLGNAVEHGSTSPRSQAHGDAVEHGSTSPRSQAHGDAVEHGSTSPPSHAHGDAVEHAGGDVHVRVGALPDGFFVEDDGPGIDESERDEVFEPGYTNRSDGTGLGLSIVRTIVEAHGWSISVTEGRDGGARFEVTGVESDG